MRGFVLLAAAAVILSASLVPEPVVAQAPPPQTLPAIDAEGRMLPLTVDQLDAVERARFTQLAPGGDDARRFLYTRGFLRYARLVVGGDMAPIDLPELPDQENYDRRFLSQAESYDVVDRALHMHLRAPPRNGARDRPRPVPVIADPTDRLPDIGPDRMIQPLRVDQLDPEELATFTTLAPGSGDSRRFLYTRGYLRFCRLVVAGELSPLDLPELPDRRNYDRNFLSVDEARRFLDAAVVMNLIAMEQPET